MSKNNKQSQSQASDELVMQLFEKVKDKKREIAFSERPSWLTSCTLGTNPDSLLDRMNIQTVTDINKLLDIYGFLLMKEDFWMKAGKELGVVHVFKWMGFSIESWKTDIQSRIAQINLTVKRKELETLETRLNGLVTLEQRRELELKEISKLLA